MKKLLFALFLALMMVCPLSAFSAGTCVTTVNTSSTTQARIQDPGVVIVTLTCVADVASSYTFPSTVVALTPSATTMNPYNLYGYYLHEVGRSTGTTQPTASYTVTVTDASGFPMDLGLLTSNGAAAGHQMTAIYSSGVYFPIVRSALTVAITGNSVSAAQITLDLIFKDHI